MIKTSRCPWPDLICGDKWNCFRLLNDWLTCLFLLFQLILILNLLLQTGKINDDQSGSSNVGSKSQWVVPDTLRVLLPSDLNTPLCIITCEGVLVLFPARGPDGNSFAQLALASRLRLLPTQNRNLSGRWMNGGSTSKTVSQWNECGL